MSRRAARETLFRIVFQFCVCGHNDFAYEKIIENASLERSLSEEDCEYTKSAYRGILDNIDALKQKISHLSNEFDFDRIYKTDLAILLISIYEIIYIEQIPPLVSINEAIELAKLYSTEKSSAFINGILASVLKEEA